MNKQQVLNEFIKQIDGLHEIEYGDFKRKLSNYILRLEQELQVRDANASNVFRLLRHKVIFNPSGDIEDARQCTLELAEKLKLLV